MPQAARSSIRSSSPRSRPGGRAARPGIVVASAAEGLEDHPGSREDVVVLGAGLAGLVAAHELTRQGHRPIALEAQNRVVGRFYALRSFAPGLPVSWGSDHGAPAASAG